MLPGDQNDQGNPFQKHMLLAIDSIHLIDGWNCLFKRWAKTLPGIKAQETKSRPKAWPEYGHLGWASKIESWFTNTFLDQKHTPCLGYPVAYLYDIIMISFKYYPYENRKKHYPPERLF